jgi:hypothetical protein
MPELVRQDAELELLAEEVRRHHKAVERHARSMLDEAIAAGEKLLEAKERLKHGEYNRSWPTAGSATQARPSTRGSLAISAALHFWRPTRSARR